MSDQLAFCVRLKSTMTDQVAFWSDKCQTAINLLFSPHCSKHLTHTVYGLPVRVQGSTICIREAYTGILLWAISYHIENTHVC